jgi:hypothetical protein
MLKTGDCGCTGGGFGEKSRVYSPGAGWAGGGAGGGAGGAGTLGFGVANTFVAAEETDA